MNEMDIFREIALNPEEYAQDWKKRTGRKVMGYLCTYAPEEIIHAAGFLPFRIFGRTGESWLADAHLQSYCCSLVRGSLETALSGTLAFLDGTVFTHTCDSMQRLSDIWRINAGIALHFDLVLPVTLGTESSLIYFIEVYKKFIRDLEAQHVNMIPEKNLADAVDLFNVIRREIYSLYLLNSRNPGVISSSDLYRIIKASAVMDRNELPSLLRGAREKISIKKPARNTKRIMLAGSLCPFQELYAIIDEAGGAVVWDDLCLGSRFFSDDIAVSGAPVESIARRYYGRGECPAKHRSLSSRGERIAESAGAHTIDGVIFLFLKFCDPHSFDYPFLREKLDAAGIKNILVEVDTQSMSHGQLKTRIQAFMEGL